LEWSDEGVEGSYRFLKRLWSYCARFDQSGPSMAAGLQKATRFEIHSVLKQANYDLQKHQFNTVASAAMKILNALETFSGGRNAVTAEGLSILLRLLSPITPHICHALWRELGFGKDVMQAEWPEPDAAALEQDEIDYVIQIGGKTRGNLRAPKTADQSALEALLTVSDVAQKYLIGKSIKRIIVVPGRLINVVV
jgi:leucyl-tRNA synthetase